MHLRFGQLIRSEVQRNVHNARLLILGSIGVGHLDIGAILAHANRSTAVSHPEGVEFTGINVSDVVQDFTQTVVTWFTEVELLQPLGTGAFAAGNLVEIFFHLGGKCIVDQVGVVLLHETNDGERNPGRNKC